MPKFEVKKNLLLKDITAVFGAINLNDANEIGRTYRSPIKITVHDTWNQNATKYEGDIAVLTFGEDIPLMNFVQPVCIFAGSVCMTSGFIGGWKQSLNGTEKVPFNINLPIDLDRQCFANITKNVLDNDVFCAGHDDTQNICPSDGAGFFDLSESGFYFRGIASFGIKDQANCDVTKFAAVIETLNYDRWTEAVMMKDESSEPEKLHCKVYDYNIFPFYVDISRNFKSCKIYHQDIDVEGLTIANPKDKELGGFSIEDNKKVKYLPEHIADLYPELVIYEVQQCSIRTVNVKHLKGLTKLEVLNLWNNEIESIDRGSFKI